MRVSIALPKARMDEALTSAQLHFSLFSDLWPSEYAQKWIPLAPSEEASVTSWRSSPGYQPGEVTVLTIHVPDETWEHWLRSGTVVDNHGWKRTGASHTPRRGHFLYGRVPKSEPDPVFDLADLILETVIYDA